jgi:hypothetical protein
MGVFLEINRRRLLTSAAIAGIAPNIPRASLIASSEITNSDSVAPPYPEVQARNFSNITNLLLREIAERNSIRQQAGLPLLCRKNFGE